MPLLTIAIPTYNRSDCLELCLEQLSRQLASCDDDVEVIVSDNCSSDDTPAVVTRYATLSPQIRYIRNSENIGAENNFIQLFEQSLGTYLLIFGDDDVWLDGALEYLLGILRSDNYGSVYLSAAVFFNDFHQEIKIQGANRHHTVYQDNQAFLERVNVNATFISSNIINKSLLPPQTDIRQFNGTSLVQLGWILPAMVNASKHVFVETPLIAGKAFNSGGFRFFDVFVSNLNAILSSFKNNGLTLNTYNAITGKLLTEFYPHRIYTIRSNKETYDDHEENVFKIFHTQYKDNPLFWLFIVPSLYLPLGINKTAIKWLRSIYKRYIRLVKLF